MELSISYGVYCIDNMVEHIRLLRYIANGICKLDRSAVPERYEEHFKPYTIESMEFEYMKLTPNEIKIRKYYKEEKDNKSFQIIDNLKLGPVNHIFADKLTSLFKRVKMLKTIADLQYLLYFKSLDDLLSCNGRNLCQQYQQLGLLFLIQLQSY